MPTSYSLIPAPRSRLADSARPWYVWFMAKTKKPLVVKNLSPKALEAIKAFKGRGKPPRTPAKLKGPNEAAIRRAVRAYYLG